jgi:hypothetical protein
MNDLNQRLLGYREGIEHTSAMKIKTQMPQAILGCKKVLDEQWIWHAH